MTCLRSRERSAPEKKTAYTQYLICCLALCLLTGRSSSAPAQMFQVEKPDTAKKCAVCHFQWVYPFFKEHRDGELVAEPKEKMVATEEMCFSCHDGSIMDSRKRVFNGFGHKVDAVPSDKVTIPEEFPLDDKGSVQCFTCHTPHAVPSGSDEDIGIFLRARNENSQFCTMCHTDRSDGAKTGNHSVDVSSETAPRELLSMGGKFGDEMENQVVCETCHIVHSRIDEGLLVVSARNARNGTMLCETCHTASPTLSKTKTAHTQSHPVNVKPNDAAIPQTWSSGEDVVRGAGGRLVCITCHAPHGAAETKSLLAENNRQDSLCVRCHEQQEPVAGTGHDLRLSAPDVKNILGQRSGDTGPCSSCHAVHQGGGNYLWAVENRVQDTTLDALCLSCHSAGQCGEKFLPGEFSHPVDITVPDDVASLSLPLYTQQGEPDRRGNMRCLTCHTSHDPAPLYPAPEDSTMRQGKFLRMGAWPPTDLCMHCHQNYGSVAKTDHDLRMTAPDYTNAAGETPDLSGLCGPCHAVHNAQQKQYLWSGPLGAAVLEGWKEDFTSPQNTMTALCTGCHAPGNCAETQVTRYGLHPKGLATPYDRTSTQEVTETVSQLIEQFPLYTDGGEVDNNGNIVCSTCHNPHQWDSRSTDEGPGDNIEGNVTNSFLRPEIHGQLCSVCHGEEGLLKFKYFHSSLGRTTAGEPFPFK